MHTLLLRLKNTNACYPHYIITIYIVYTIYTLYPCCRLDRSYNGQNTTVVGWGKLSEGGDPADVLMEVTVPVITQKKCRRHTRYPPLELLTSFLHFVYLFIPGTGTGRVR